MVIISEKNSIITVKDARIIHRNFAGEERKFNAAGRRNFNLILSEEDAEKLSELGLNVRVREPRDEFESPMHLLKINVSYKIRSPKVVVISNGIRTELTEDTIDELDGADIEKLDLSFRPSHYKLYNGSEGLSAYLYSLYATLYVDPLSSEYDAVPDEAEKVPNR